MTDIPHILEEVIPADRISRDEPMSAHTTMRVGGAADVFVRIASAGELGEAIRLLRSAGEAYVVVGRGSNLIVSDRGYRGTVLCTSGSFAGISCRESEDGKVYLKADAGTLLGALASYACERELTGLEFAAGIPGTVGGAVRMNAGAYGSETADLVASVSLLSPDGSLTATDAAGMDFAYRHSRVSESGEIVTDCTFVLTVGDRQAIIARMEELATARRDKQPLEYPSSGSTWKRPEGHFAAKLLEEAGCKGLRVGDAQISEKHSGFVINRGSATASDILKLMRMAEDRVFEASGVRLTPEVEFIGMEGDDR